MGEAVELSEVLAVFERWLAARPLADRSRRSDDEEHVADSASLRPTEDPYAGVPLNGASSPACPAEVRRRDAPPAAIDLERFAIAGR